MMVDEKKLSSPKEKIRVAFDLAQCVSCLLIIIIIIIIATLTGFTA
jgi:hypothetical protein